jgi:hypothetical protein
MDDQRLVRPKAEVLAVLRRAGTPEETIRALDAVLDDPVDIERDLSLLAHHGITRGRLTDAMGGSP